MIRIMSFNIRCSNCDDGENNWEKRRALVVARIRAAQPDLLGVQECRDDDQAAFLKENLPEYEFHGVRRGGDGVTALEMAPLLFRKDSFQLVRNGFFWLSQTPQAPGSKSWDAVFARSAAWAELVHRPSGRRLVFLNTHFDYQPQAILGAARLLRAWAEQTSRRAPLIVTGDFNADKTSAAYQELTADGLLNDAHRAAHPGAADAVTFHGYGNPAAFTTIDWILLSGQLTALSATVDGWRAGERYPSDHYPILAEVEWK